MEMKMDIAAFTLKFSHDIAFQIPLPDLGSENTADSFIPDEILTVIQSSNEGKIPIGEFQNIQPGMSGTSSDLNLLSLLSETYGHAMSISCGERTYSSRDIFLIPPTDNPVPTFLASQLDQQLNLFPDADWRTDTLVAVISVMPSVFCEYDPCCDETQGPPDFSQCTISVGEDITDVEVAINKPECSIEEVQHFTSIVSPVLSKLEESGTAVAFNLQLAALSLIPLVDGIQGCVDLLESMLITSEVPVWVPGVRRCTAVTEEEWTNSPCCNPQKAFEQCCPLEDVQELSTVIEEVVPAQQCDTAAGASLDNALMSYSVAFRLRNDANTGCAAERRRKFSTEKLNKLFDFFDTCDDILFQGKTKAGLETCDNDNECYTKCQQHSPMMMQGPSGDGDKKCSPPFENYEGPFIECALDNAESSLLNWMRKTLGVSASEPLSTLKKSIKNQLGENSCVGSSGADGAVCLLNIPEAECDANVFNFAQDSWESTILVDRSLEDESTCNAESGRQWYSVELNMIDPPDYGGSSYGNGNYGYGGPSYGYGGYDSCPELWLNDGFCDEDDGMCPLGTDTADCGGFRRKQQQQNHPRSRLRHRAPHKKDTTHRKLLDHEYADGYYYPPSRPSTRRSLGCVCTDSGINDYDSNCQRVTLDWSVMKTLQDNGNPLVPSWSKPPSLMTKFLRDAPDNSQGQCRISAFDAVSQWNFETRFLEDLEDSSARGISEYLCTALGKTVATVNGWSFLIDSVVGYYESFNPHHEWIYDDAEGTYIRHQTSAGSQAWCEYEQSCNHKPWDATAGTQEKCVDDYQTFGPKAAQGASFCAQCDGPWCWEFSSPPKCVLANVWDKSACADKEGAWIEDHWTCAVDAKADHTEATCMPEVCSKEIFTYQDYTGVQQSHTSFGFCEYTSACYAPPTQVASQDDCVARGGEWYMNVPPKEPGGFRRSQKNAASSSVSTLGSGSHSPNSPSSRSHLLRKVFGISKASALKSTYILSPVVSVSGSGPTTPRIGSAPRTSKGRSPLQALAAQVELRRTLMREKEEQVRRREENLVSADSSISECNRDSMVTCHPIKYELKQIPAGKLTLPAGLIFSTRKFRLNLGLSLLPLISYRRQFEFLACDPPGPVFFSVVCGPLSGYYFSATR